MQITFRVDKAFFFFYVENKYQLLEIQKLSLQMKKVTKRKRGHCLVNEDLKVRAFNYFFCPSAFSITFSIYNDQL